MSRLPTRQETVADAGEVTSGPRKRKNLREFCRGNPKTPHTPTVEVIPWARPREVACRWVGADYNRASGRYRRYRWLCMHRRVCSSCGKVTTAFLGAADCPDYQPRQSA